MLLGAAALVGGAIIGVAAACVIDYLTEDKLKKEVKRRENGRAINKLVVEVIKRKRENRVLRVGLFDEEDVRVGTEEIECKTISPKIREGQVMYV